jgi:hypothetical protein
MLLSPLAFAARLVGSSGTSPSFLLSVTGMSQSASRRTPYMRVSPHTAQASLSPLAGRGFVTANRWLWTCLWQFGWRRTRFSRLSVPPSERHLMWWLCHPVNSVIFSLQTGQMPSCSLQRSISPRRPFRFVAIFTPRRSSK